MEGAKSRVALRDERGGSSHAATLTSVSVTADVVECGVSVELEQTFYNDNECPLEALYEFVLPPKAAVCEFRIEVEDGRQIGSELVRLDEAKDKYDDALASGHSAYLLSGEQVFSVSVGLLLPRKEVVIRLRYISALTVNLGMARTMSC